MRKVSGLLAIGTMALFMSTGAFAETITFTEKYQTVEIDVTEAISIEFTVNNGISSTGGYGYPEKNADYWDWIPFSYDNPEQKYSVDISTIDEIASGRKVIQFQSWDVNEPFEVNYKITYPNQSVISETGELKRYFGEGGDVIIPDNVTSIGDKAFQNCTDVRSITIPSSVKKIGKEAFANCSNLVSVDIKEGVTEIGESAFDNCGALTSVSIPKSLTYFNRYLFTSCPSLSELYYAGSKEDWQNIQPYGGDTISKQAYVFYNGNKDINKCWMDSTLYFRGDGKLYLSENGPKEFTIGKGDTWDAEGNKLTLNGLNFNSDRWYGLYLTEDTIIELKKDSNNTISCGKVAYDNPEMYLEIFWLHESAIYSSGNLIITGDGILNLNGTCVRAIDCGGNLSVEGGAKINANITTAPSYTESYYIEEIDETRTLTYETAHAPILFVRGNLTIADAQIIGETGEAWNSIGIYTIGSTDVKNSYVKLTTGEDSSISWGIYGEKDFNIEKSTLDLKSKSGYRCLGINAKSTLSITESDIIIVSEEGEEYSVPIFANGLNSLGSKFNLCAEKSGITEGFDIKGKSEFKDCIVDVSLDNGEKSSYGICATDDVTITGNSIVTLNVGKDSPVKAGISIEENEEAGVCIQGEATVKSNSSLLSTGTISVKENAFVSAYEKINAAKGITVSDAILANSIGYKEKLENGKTTELTAVKLEEPIIFTSEEIKEDTPAEPEKTDNPFTDVKNGKYYTDSILYLNSKGVMTGLNKTMFGFNRLLSREDMVVLLWKNEGKPGMNVTTNVFKDIKPGKYYTDAVSWAKKYSIVGGYTSGAKNGYFGKGDNITRQDFIKIIYGYAQFKKYDTSVKSADSYKEKKDAANVSKYARESINWAYEKELIGNGSPLNPKKNITRQDAAVIIARFLKAFDK